MLADLEPACSSSSDAVINALRTLEVGTAALAALQEARQAALDVCDPPRSATIGGDRHNSLDCLPDPMPFQSFPRLQPDSDLADARKRVKQTTRY